MKVTLLGTNRPVWRRVLVDRDMTLRDLHLTLRAVMGWGNSHLHQFVLPRRWNRKPQHGFCTKIVNESRTGVSDVIGTAGESRCYTNTISAMAGSTSFGWRKFRSETNPFSRCAWRENDVVRRKTVAGRKGSPRCSPHYGTPVTPVTRNSVSGSAISILRLSLLTKLPDGYAGVGSIKTDTWTYFAPEYGRPPRS